MRHVYWLVVLAVVVSGLAQTPQASKTVPSKSSSAAKETYRGLKSEDGFSFVIHGGLYSTPIEGGPPSGTILQFGVIDTQGGFHELPLVSHNLVSGRIQTKMIGAVRMDSSIGPATAKISNIFMVTETQVKKIQDFLAAQSKRPAPTK